MSPLSAVSSVNRPLAGSALSSVDAGGAPAKASPADLQKASRQFEAILVRQMIGPAIEPMMTGGSLGGKEDSGSGGGGVYAYMLTDVLSNSITQGGGLGLSAVISRQLSPAHAPAAE